MNLLFDLLFSKKFKLYNDWLNKGIINDSFSASFMQERETMHLFKLDVIVMTMKH